MLKKGFVLKSRVNFPLTKYLFNLKRFKSFQTIFNSGVISKQIPFLNGSGSLKNGPASGSRLRLHNTGKN